MSVQTRRAVEEDVHRIAEIHVAAWQATYRGILTDETLAGLSVERRAAVHLENVRDPSSPRRRTRVVEEQGRVVGFSVTGPERDEGADPDRVGEIYAMYLDPAERGRGLGRVLMAACLAELRDQGFGDVVLWVLTENEAARRFYEANGFTLDGGEKTMDFGGVASTVVRLRLGG